MKFLPFLLGGHHQLVGHDRCRLAAKAALGLGGSMPNGGEGAFDRIGRTDVLSVFGQQVVEGEQIGLVLGQAFDRPVIFNVLSFNEEIEGGIRSRLGFCHPDVLQMRFGFRLDRFRHGIEYLRRLVNPAALHPRLAVTSCRAAQNPIAPSPKANFGAASRPRRFRFSSNSRQLWVLSRKPSIRPKTSLLPHSSARIITSIHWRSSSIRGVK